MWLKKSYLVVVLGMMLVLVSSAVAQDESIAVTGTFGDGPSSFSQIYCTDTACTDIVGYMFMSIIGVDPAEQAIVPGAEGALAEDWEISDDNLTYTIKLREDAYWTDGEQIDADDIMFHYELMQNPDAGHPVAYILDEFKSVEKLDDFTIEVVMNSPSCSALNNIGGLDPIPSHILSDYDAEELATIDFNTSPSVTSGTFTFGQYRSGELVTLLTNPDFVDTPEELNLDGFIQIVSTDSQVLLEQLFEGEINFLEGISATQQDRVRDQENLQVYEYPGNSWDYMAFNLADSNNPQPSIDENGDRVDQGLHPIFSDKLVRNAIGHAVDVDDIIEGALFGNGTRMSSHIPASSWAFNDELDAREYDVEQAEELLEEAGWVLNDDGERVCEDCLYAREVDEDYNGTVFEFDLLTNAGNDRRESIGTIIQDQLKDLGIKVNFQTVEFNTILEIIDSQDFDAFILGWRAAYPDRPDTIQLFGREADVPSSGFNFTSFYNEDYFELEEQADTIPGCDQEARHEIYKQMQEIMYDEMPYLWLFSQNGMFAATDNVEGFDPYPNSIDWNMTEWAVQVD